MARVFSVGTIPKNIPTWQYNAFRQIAASLTGANDGMSAILRGEAPDGSGLPLVDLTKYLYLPGRPGGQTVLSVDTLNPTVTISQNAIGSVIQRWSTTGLTAMDISLEVNGSGNDVVFTGPRALAIRVGDNSSGLRFTTGGYVSASGLTSNRGWIESGKVGGTDQNLMMTGFNGDGIGSILQTGYRGIYFGDFRTSSVSAIIVRTCIGLRVDPADYAGGTGVGGFSPVSAGSGPAVAMHVLADASQSGISFEGGGTGSSHALEMRQDTQSSVAPNKLLGALTWAMDAGNGRMYWFFGGSPGSETKTVWVDLDINANDAGWIRFVDVQGNSNMLLLKRQASTWSDAITCTRVVLDGSNRAVITGRLDAALTRFGISSKGTLISNSVVNDADFLAPATNPEVLQVVNSVSGGNDASPLLVLNNRRSGQTANLVEILNSAGAKLAYVDPAGMYHGSLAIVAYADDPIFIDDDVVYY
jgi:hypothetical protein